MTSKSRIIAVRRSAGWSEERVREYVVGGREGELAPVFTLPRHTSAVQLERALVLLVRPDRRRALQIHVPVAADAAKGPLELLGGQPGVFYDLRRDGGKTPVGLPGYFHQRDDRNPQLNKGVSQLRIGVDFALARPNPVQHGQRATTPPLPPQIKTGPLPFRTELQGVARKAMSGVQAELAGTAAIEAPPAVRVEPRTVEAGASAKVVIGASAPGERYRLLRADVVVSEAEGTGAAVELSTGPLTQSVTLVLAIERAGAGPAVISRRIELAVDVSPAK